jgi:D-alanyl-D-alanine carboxypeptidase (penicillin-binding protein 5/6)
MRTGRFPTGIVTAVAVIIACAALAALGTPPPTRAVAAEPTPTQTSASTASRATVTTTRDPSTAATAVTATTSASTSPPASAIPGTIAWPQAAEAAVTVQGYPSVTVHGATTPVPIASLAKVMTAYVVLTDHPLTATSQGPTITVTQADVALYAAESADGDSTVKVAAGERLTERQALEAMLLQSANNLAVLFTRWDAGGKSAFLQRMNSAAARLGLRSTHYADPAGLSSGTVSTAADQVRLALAALGLPAFAAIVAMPSAAVPVAGTVPNHDTMLGVDGIVGVKTGYTAAAGGTMVVAARTTAHGRRVLIVGAVLGVSGGPAVAFGRTLDAADDMVRDVEHRLQS